jgi:hypothetical protein
MINRLKSIALEVAILAYMLATALPCAYALDYDLRTAYVATCGFYAIALFLIKYRRQPFTTGAGILQSDENKIRYGMRTLHDAVETGSVFALFMIPVILQALFVNYLSGAWPDI